MKQYKYGIDFITVAFYRFEYIELLVRSIEKYVTDLPYTIHIVNNGQNEGEGNGYDYLKTQYKTNPNVKIYKGIDQTKESNSKMQYTCEIDGRKVGVGSLTQAQAMVIGIKNSNREYLCYCESDIIFLNQIPFDYIKKSLNKNVFIDHRWRDDLNIASSQLTFLKRETIENNRFKKEKNLYPSIKYKDTGGLLTLWAQKNKKSFEIMLNSYNHPHLKKEHLLNISGGEQVWLNNIAIAYHMGHGSTKEAYKFAEWVNETNKYLNNN